MKTRAVMMAALTLACLGSAQADENSAADRVRMNETVISGNQELPKVLYILPWQSSNGRPALELSAGLDDQRVFRRVEPAAYQRELKYRDALERMEQTED
jgi:hypothetical protein